MMNSTVNLTTFEAPTNSTTQLFGPLNILDILNILFGLPTHFYVIWLIVTGTESEIASGFFNLNLSVCEIGNCLNSLLSLVEMCFTSAMFKALIQFVMGLGVTGRCLFQCMMCIECYLAVVHPVTFLKYKPLRYRVISCAVVWIITLVSCFCCMFIAGLFYIYVWYFSLQFFLFFFIQLFCLVAVLRVLKQSGPGERKKEENHMKRRAFHIILITIVSMTFLLVPLTFFGLLSILTNISSTQFFTFALFCYILAGFVQPVFYLNRVGKLSCHKIFKCFVFRS